MDTPTMCTILYLTPSTRKESTRATGIATQSRSWNGYFVCCLVLTIFIAVIYYRFDTWQSRDNDIRLSRARLKTPGSDSNGHHRVEDPAASFCTTRSCPITMPLPRVIHSRRQHGVHSSDNVQMETIPRGKVGRVSEGIVKFVAAEIALQWDLFRGRGWT